MKKKLVSALLTITMAMGVFSIIPNKTVKAATWSTTPPEPFNGGTNYSISNNIWLHERSDGGLTYIYALEGAFYIQEFPGAGGTYRTTTIDNELRYAAGYYNDGTYHYLLWGQGHGINATAKDENLRVIKYDSAWNRIASCSVDGTMFHRTFCHAGLSISGSNGKLAIQFEGNCYHDYTESVIIDTDSMTFKHLDVGYVHSIDNYTYADDKMIYMLNTGYSDALGSTLYFRSIEEKVPNPLDVDPVSDYIRHKSDISFNKDIEDDLFALYGYEKDSLPRDEHGCRICDTVSYPTVGGLVTSKDSDKLIVVGTYKTLKDTYDGPGYYTDYSGAESDYHLFFYLCDRTTGENVEIKEFKTDYLYDTRIVKINENRFIVFWSDISGVKAIAIDGYGNIISEEHSLSVKLPLRAPGRLIYTSDGKIKCMDSDRNGNYLYIIDPNTFESMKITMTSAGVDLGLPVNIPTINETGVAGFVERLYQVALGRSSDAKGKADWINRVTTEGKTGADLAMGFLYSDEFLNKPVGDGTFLEILYATFFNRPGDMAGKNNWLNSMATGMSRKEVIRGFIDSTEFANLCLDYGIASGSKAQPNKSKTASDEIYAFVDRLYDKCLGRAGDANGRNGWASDLANMRKSGSVVAYGFFFSAEFINKNVSNEEYVTLLYRVFMDREPDAGGFNDWVGKLNAGASRKAVFDGFTGSQEWIGICASYGILK